MGFLSDLNRKRKKVTKKILNPVVKGVSKITDRFIPNELRFLAPYAAGIGTLMLSPGMGPLARGFAGAGLSGLGQIAADETPIEDISELNEISMLLAAGLGSLGSDEVSGAMRDGIVDPKDAIRNQMAEAPIGLSQVPSDFVQPNVGFMQGAENVAREGIAQASDYITGGRQDLINLGRNPGSLFEYNKGLTLNKAPGASKALSALGPTFALATGDVAYEDAVDRKLAQDKLDQEEAALIEETTTANKSERASLQMTMMRQAGIPEDTVEETLAMNDLSEYYTPPESAAYGGLMGRPEYEFGGITEALMNSGSRGLMTQNKAMGGIMSNDKTYHQYHDQTAPMDMESMMGYNMGGSVLPRGMEMDYRGGGFIPMGSKERADDVPARVSKNEFVMTADAVRAAGGGSVNKGAKRMYDLMNNLEAKV